MVRARRAADAEILVETFSEVRCYIDEYEGVPGVPGSLSARLREKGTRRKVELSGTAEDGRKLMQFLAGPRAQGLADTLPDLYETTGEDCVLVSGEVEIDSAELVRFTVNDSLTLAFA